MQTGAWSMLPFVLRKEGWYLLFIMGGEEHSCLAMLGIPQEGHLKTSHVSSFWEGS